MADENRNLDIGLCPNCGDSIEGDLKTCPSCKASLLERNEMNGDGILKTSSSDSSIFICQNCGSFIGLNATHCNACGARRTPVTAKIDISLKEEESWEKGGQSRVDQLLNSSPGLFLCGNCGAFLSPEAIRCEVCGVDVGENEDQADNEEEVESIISQGAVADVLSSEGELFLCRVCGAFVNPKSESCSICGTNLEDFGWYEEKTELLEEVDADSKLATPGAIYLCENCGSFLGGDGKECARCGAGVIIGRVTEEEEGIELPDAQSELIAVEEFYKIPEKETETQGFKIRGIEREKTRKRTKEEIMEECTKLLLGKAIALKKLGRYNEALKSLNKALTLSPENKKIMLCKADMYYEFGRYGQAAKLYKYILESDGEKVPIWNKLGNSLFRLGYQKESLICYERALELDANNREAMINKGYLLMKMERYDETIKFAEKVVA